MLSQDLDKRVSETTKKFSFNFLAEEPMKDAEGPFTWEKTEGTPKVRPICRLQPKPKPKMSLDAIIGTKGDIGRLSLVGRNSIFSSSAATDTTACTSKLEDGGRLESGASILSGSIAFNNDMDASLNQSGFDFVLRPTVGLNCKPPRRTTIDVYGGTILEDSRESCLDSALPRDSKLEGTINSTNDQVTNIKSASKSGSVSSYRNGSPLREGLKTNRSSGSGQKRDLKMRSEAE